MLGQLKLQLDDFWEAMEMARKNGLSEIVCPLAGWITGDPGEEYLTVELQPPYRPKPKPVENALDSNNLIRIDDTQLCLRWRRRERVRVIHQLEAK